MTALEREQAMLQRWRALPSEKQQEALDYMEALAPQTVAGRPLRSALGLCADLNVKITAEDISEAREEMWDDFPRDIKL
jgi:hypothetical protein